MVIFTTSASCLLETKRIKRNALKDFLVRVGVWPSERAWLNSGFGKKGKTKY